MAEQYIQVPPNSTGLKVRTQEITANAVTVEMENVVLSDPTTAANMAAVSAAGALKVDGSAVTQPVSAASLPLPSGAATAAKQPALGTAGTASSDVISVQGIASMTKLLVTPDSVALPNHQSTNVDQLNGTTTDTNSGTKSAGTLRVVIATDQPALTNKLLVTPDLPSGASTSAKQPALGTAGSASADVITVQGVASMTALKVDGSGVTQPISGAISFTAPQHTIIDSGTVTAVTAITNALPAGTNVLGHVITDSGSVTAATLSAETTKVIGTVRCEGNVGGAFDAATNAAPPANAVQIGMVAATALPTAYTATDLVAPMVDKFGRQVVIPQAMRDLILTQATTITSSTSLTTILASGGTGVYTDLTSLTITNSSATNLIVTLTDGTTNYIYALAANGGITMPFSPPLPAASTATVWSLTCGTSVASIYVVVKAVKNK